MKRKFLEAIKQLEAAQESKAKLIIYFSFKIGFHSLFLFLLFKLFLLSLDFICYQLYIRYSLFLSQVVSAYTGLIIYHWIDSGAFPTKNT